MSLTPPYKAPSGHWYTSSLFYEETIKNQMSERATDPIFSFNGREGLIDAHSTFIALGDPTGYLWATTYLKSWDHFLQLLKAKWFRSEYDKWTEELKIILRQKAVEKIKEIATGDSSQALAAAKYIASAEWEKSTSGRGRPSKSDITGELKKAAEAAASDNDDAQRVGLKVIKGGKS